MVSNPITSWQINGETIKTVTEFILGGSKITADGDCSHEIKSCLLLGRKVMTSLDSILKIRGITLPTKVCLVKAMVFPVVMHGCEKETEVTQSCPTLCDPMDCSLPGSSVHGIFQAIVLEWIDYFLLQGIFPTQGLNPGLLRCRQTLYCLSHWGSRQLIILKVN